MREFEYFLFENFDADRESGNPQNPRTFLGKDTDAILSEIVQYGAGVYSYHDCCNKFSGNLVQQLLDGGVLRTVGERLMFNCPVFLREDAAILRMETTSRVEYIIQMLEDSMSEIRETCSKIKNGFSIEENLYHILCGMIFDGCFFDYLCGKGALAVSRKHSSGLDYLIIIYEKCGELQKLSNGLLCSYNRLFNGKCVLQSFGDAQGSRFDFYRFFRLIEQGNVPAKFKAAESLMLRTYGGTKKEEFLTEVVSFIETGRCISATMSLLEQFGYARNGSICVPIYWPEHQKYIRQIEQIIERSLGNEVSETLIELAGMIDIMAVRHNVNPLEIANELYHLLFGFINEELVSRNMVVTPKHIPGEGRYLKSIEMRR